MSLKPFGAHASPRGAQGDSVPYAEAALPGGCAVDPGLGAPGARPQWSGDRSSPGCSGGRRGCGRGGGSHRALPAFSSDRSPCREGLPWSPWQQSSVTQGLPGGQGLPVCHRRPTPQPGSCGDAVLTRPEGCWAGSRGRGHVCMSGRRGHPQASPQQPRPALERAGGWWASLPGGALPRHSRQGFYPASRARGTWALLSPPGPAKHPPVTAPRVPGGS